MPRGHKKNIVATLAAREAGIFRCKDSFLSTDGHEFLAEKDWKRRARECFERDGYRCQWVVWRDAADNFRLCLAAADHPHHIKPKGKGGSDDLGNLMAICGFHHKIAHPEKQTKWSKR